MPRPAFADSERLWLVCVAGASTLIALVAWKLLYALWTRSWLDGRRRVVVVTGAASGIGRALCEILTLRHDDLVVALDIDADGLRELEAWHAARRPDGLMCVRCDVSEPASVAQVQFLNAFFFSPSDLSHR